MAVVATPAWRRPSSLDEETKKWFGQRRSTFDDFPQYLFPAGGNYVDDDCDTPYAFSHHQAAFYWTRQDALSGLIWNYASRPPCLNCVLAGEAVAKRCNRMARQWESEGRESSCKYCEGADFVDACIEMVEIRIVPRFVALLPDGTVMNPQLTLQGLDSYLWTEEEKSLRKQGKVFWRPLNLHVGDIESKSELMVDFESGGTGDLTKTAISPGLWQRRRFDVDVEAWSKARKMMKRKVHRWDREEADLEAVRAVADLDLTTTETRGRTPTVHLGATYEDDEYHSAHNSEIQEGIGAQAAKWKAAFLRVEPELYGRDGNELGKASHVNELWDENNRKIMTAIEDFFEQKTSFLEQGMGEEYACWEAAKVLPWETREWVDEHIPGILCPVIKDDWENIT